MRKSLILPRYDFDTDKILPPSSIIISVFIVLVLFFPEYDFFRFLLSYGLCICCSVTSARIFSIFSGVILLSFVIVTFLASNGSILLSNLHIFALCTLNRHPKIYVLCKCDSTKLRKTTYLSELIVLPWHFFCFSSFSHPDLTFSTTFSNSSIVKPVILRKFLGVSSYYSN